MNANSRLIALLPTRTAIGGFPKVAFYDMLGEQLHYRNTVKSLHKLVAREGKIRELTERMSIGWWSVEKTSIWWCSAKDSLERVDPNWSLRLIPRGQTKENFRSKTRTRRPAAIA